MLYLVPSCLIRRRHTPVSTPCPTRATPRRYCSDATPASVAASGLAAFRQRYAGNCSIWLVAGVYSQTHTHTLCSIQLRDSLGMLHFSITVRFEPHDAGGESSLSQSHPSSLFLSHSPLLLLFCHFCLSCFVSILFPGCA